MNSGKDGGQLGGFGLQGGESRGWQQTAVLCELKPKKRFINFLQYAADLINPIGFASSPTRCAITRGYSGCGPHDLVRNHLALGVSRQSIGHCHNSQSKLFRSGLQLFSIHPRNVRGSASVRKHKS